MGYQQRKFIDCKILFGKEFTFSDRVDFVTRLLSDKNLSAFIGHKHMRLFYLNEYGIEEDIGYITDLKGKLTARSVGQNSCYIFADMYLTTKDSFILDQAWKYLDSHKNAYKLWFKSSDPKDGMCIKFNV